ncbi:hypothetical protein WR25_22041 isoform A [Diploscapter pachys]|uniref:SSD domain-containing protein n=1 Tax=Diploscapter pachys TaxID=2018661 RepID=A0A2A2LEC6_9BILA|nr:hypothetical protein WR25_22041 isoform A [Diploscapter pachys]
MVRFDCVEKRFAKLFGNYSTIVVRYPLPFFILPILLSCGLGIGLTRHKQAFMKDELELYTPTDAQARRELKQLDTLFHINDSDPFYATRRYDIRRSGYIIVTQRDDEDILNPLVMHAAMQLWSVVQALTVEDQEDRHINYPSICVKFPIPPEFSKVLHSLFSPNITTPDEICVSNPLVEMFKLLLVSDRSFLNRSIDEMTLGQISDAVQFDSGGMRHLLGGITLDSEKRIAGAKAIMLPYALRHSSQVEDWLAEKWELRLADFLLQYDSPVIRASWWTYETLAAESARDRNTLIRMLIPCFCAVSIYTVICCCVLSWRRSRPWLAIGGVISAAMACESAVGLLLLLGYGMTSVAYSMPFIVFSVGVDNVFILLSAWRATPTNESMERRMHETFADAAVSITVTSLTDLISFAVGCATPFPSVQMFCMYAVVAVIFTYIYQLTFFAAVMVYTCRREINNRNCVTFTKLEKDKGRHSFEDSLQPEELGGNSWTLEKKVSVGDRSFEKNHVLARFFRTTYADVLLNPLFRIIILALFAAYLGISIWGCTKVKLGLEPNDLLPDNSYGKRSLQMAEKYFSDYGSYLHVWMYNLSTTDIGNRRIWSVLEKEIELYEHTEFTGSSDSWLRTFLSFVKQSGLLITTDNFVYILKNVFLSQPQFSKYARDVVLDTSGTLLDASRIPVQLRHVGSTNQSRAMHLFRRLAETSELPTGVYADFFQFAEQYNAVLPGTLSSIACAGAAVIAVSLILIPEPVASLWVSFSIVSINIGILGLMTFWSVRLDFISMVTIVMSIGFCVDFAAHIAYNFAKGKDITADERMRNALYAVGAPILMSASSTILGVSFMATAESYVFRSFLKTIILVVVLGVLHGLVILPVLLTLFYCGDSAASKKNAERLKSVHENLAKKYPVLSAISSSSAAVNGNGPPPSFMSGSLAAELYSLPPSTCEYSLSSLEYSRSAGSSYSSRPPDYEETQQQTGGGMPIGMGQTQQLHNSGGMLFPMRAKLKPKSKRSGSGSEESESPPSLDYFYHTPSG